MGATREVNIGGVAIGAKNPVAIQSMTNTDTKDADATAAQIEALFNAGCEIARVSVYDKECARALRRIKKRSPIPIVADIHFNHELALASIENGADKIRINPGNIGTSAQLALVAREAASAGIPIRVGVNSGSVERDLAALPKAEALYKSAKRNVELLEDAGFFNIVISLKSPDVGVTVEAYRRIAQSFDYPLHIGVTEAGALRSSLIKSSAALGALLIDGIGDTVRVSITGDPVDEVRAARDILNLCGVRRFGPVVVSCPTCARTGVDVIAIAAQVESRVAHIDVPMTIAVMGCAVNGPGEAKDADFGIAGGGGRAAVFARGGLVETVDESMAVDALLRLIERTAG